MSLSLLKWFMQNNAVNQQRPSIVKTADYTLSRRETGSTVTNLGATGEVIITLPTNAKKYDIFHFNVSVAQNLKIQLPATHVIVGGVATAGQSYTANAVKESVTLQFLGLISGTPSWLALNESGTWTAA